MREILAETRVLSLHDPRLDLYVHIISVSHLKHVITINNMILALIDFT